MSRQGQTHPVVVHGFPRVSGDEPLSARLKAVKLAFSPRERG